MAIAEALLVWFTAVLIMIGVAGLVGVLGARITQRQQLRRVHWEALEAQRQMQWISYQVVHAMLEEAHRHQLGR